jgi:UPF0755 protein
MRRWLILGSALTALGAGLGYGALALFQAPGPLARATDVVVPHGGLQEVADALDRAGVTDDPLALRIFAALTSWQGPLHAAELGFPARASLEQVLSVLRTGRPVQHLLTIPEGLTSAQVAELLVHADGLQGELDLPAEGSVLPQTYAYERGTRRQAVLQRAQAAMQRSLSRAWQTRDADVPVHSAAAMLVVASLVERETHLPAERAMVAGVFYNRLRRGMRLQSDPTVVYAESGGQGELAQGLSRAALERDTPYNTYVVPGLPGGPICNPGIAAIEAAAHPARTNALYFVADGAGGHVFADSLDEHLKNVQRYRALSR